MVQSQVLCRRRQENSWWVSQHCPLIFFEGALHQALLDPGDPLDVLDDPLHRPLEPPRRALRLLQQPRGLLQGDRQPEPAPWLLHVSHLRLQGERQEQGQSEVWVDKGRAQRIGENFARNNGNDGNGCRVKKLLRRSSKMGQGKLMLPFLGEKLFALKREKCWM